MKRWTQAIDYGNPVNRDCALNRGLRAWYKVMPMWNCGGRWRDLCGQYHGTFSGISPTTAWITGLGRGSYGALLTDATDDYIDISTIGRVDGHLTVIWCGAFSSIGAVTRYVLSDRSGSGAFDVSLARDTRNIVFNHGGTGTLVMTTSSFLNANQRYCIAGVRTGSSGAWNGEIFVDGVSVVTGSKTPDPNAAGTACRISTNGNAGSGFLDAKHESLRIYNRALTASEINQVYLEDFAGNTRTINRMSLPMGFEAPAAPGGGFTINPIGGVPGQGADVLDPLGF